MQQISFQGNFLKPVTIKKLDIDGTYKPIQASFVEFDHDDVYVLSELARSWKKPKSGIISNVVDCVVDPPDVMKRRMARYLPLTKGMKEEDIPMFLSSQVIGTHIYGVTLQGDNFTKIEPNKILGLVEFDVREHRNQIATLQTRPDCISAKYGNEYWRLIKQGFCMLFGIKDKKPKRPYGDIGDAIVTTLQDAYNTRRMELIPLNSAKGFYRRHGFHLDSASGFEYVWEPSYGKKV